MRLMESPDRWGNQGNLVREVFQTFPGLRLGQAYRTQFPIGPAGGEVYSCHMQASLCAHGSPISGIPWTPLGHITVLQLSLCALRKKTNQVIPSLKTM